VSGRDPLLRRIGDAEIRIVRVIPLTAWLSNRGIGDEPFTKDKLIRLCIYAYARNGVKIETCRELTRQLAGELPFYEVHVSLSDTPWFTNDPDYPGAWPFVAGLHYPSLQEHMASTTIVCRADGEKTGCERSVPR